MLVNDDRALVFSPVEIREKNRIAVAVGFNLILFWENLHRLLRPCGRGVGWEMKPALSQEGAQYAPHGGRGNGLCGEEPDVPPAAAATFAKERDAQRPRFLDQHCRQHAQVMLFRRREFVAVPLAVNVNATPAGEVV